MPPLQNDAPPLTLRRDPPAAESRARRWTSALALAVAGLIHLMPLPGLFGAPALRRLYDLTLDGLTLDGVATHDGTLLILLQHRAVLFGLLGALLLAAIRVAAWRAPALGAGLVSTASFLVIALGQDNTSAALQRVLVADVVAFTCLVVATWLHVASRARRSAAT